MAYWNPAMTRWCKNHLRDENEAQWNEERQKKSKNPDEAKWYHKNRQAWNKYMREYRKLRRTKIIGKLCEKCGTDGNLRITPNGTLCAHCHVVSFRTKQA